MAAAKSSDRVEPGGARCTARSPAAADRLHTVLATFFAARVTPRSSPWQPARLCVGLSGGRDSVVLLHALSALLSFAQLPVALSAVHVHHGLSANADAWADFCASFCRQCAVPLLIVRVDVPRESGEGPEAAARRMRHGVFAECAADWLALAHHRDDQAETVLLNLLRGAGIAGAAGMLAERPQPRGPSLVRPLLDVPRTVLERYAAEHALGWMDDESNDDVHLRRNYLRHEVMPRLEEKFAGAVKSLGRAASHFAAASLLLDELAAIDRAALASPSGRIGLPGFNALSGARAGNLLRFAWTSAGFRAPDTRWIAEALRQLAATTALSETCLATADGELHVYRGELHLIGHRPPVPDCPVPWSGEAELPWAGGRVRFVPVIGSGLRRTLLAAGAVKLRARQGGERLQADAGRPRRSLRKLLQESAIPPWQRERLPLLWCGGRLAWVGGLGIDTALASRPGEAGILPVWDEPA
jgi:tRNA(Ile)-lysidine synthase